MKVLSYILVALLFWAAPVGAVRIVEYSASYCAATDTYDFAMTIDQPFNFSLDEYGTPLVDGHFGLGLDGGEMVCLIQSRDGLVMSVYRTPYWTKIGVIPFVASGPHLSCSVPASMLPDPSYGWYYVHVEIVLNNERDARIGFTIPEGCSAVPTDRVSWGSVKARYR
jgi:hypothetical protein